MTVLNSHKPIAFSKVPIYQPARRHTAKTHNGNIKLLMTDTSLHCICRFVCSVIVSFLSRVNGVSDSFACFVLVNYIELEACLTYLMLISMYTLVNVVSMQSIVQKIKLRYAAHTKKHSQKTRCNSTRLGRTYSRSS